MAGERRCGRATDASACARPTGDAPATAPDGKYAGPVVVGRKGAYAILGARAGARLGRVKIDARRGYARLARTRHGVPLGAADAQAPGKREAERVQPDQGGTSDANGPASDAERRDDT
jgi:hypothetical protein